MSVLSAMAMRRSGRADVLAIMILMSSIVLLAGCFLYLLTNPSFSLGYKPGDPHMLFKPAGQTSTPPESTEQSITIVAHTEYTLNQTVLELKSRGITVVECRLNNYDEDKCKWVNNEAIIQFAIDKKLAILHTTNAGEQVLLVPLKDSYIAWRFSSS